MSNRKDNSKGSTVKLALAVFVGIAVAFMVIPNNDNMVYASKPTGDHNNDGHADGGDNGNGHDNSQTHCNAHNESHNPHCDQSGNEGNGTGTGTDNTGGDSGSNTGNQTDGGSTDNGSGAGSNDSGGNVGSESSGTDSTGTGTETSADDGSSNSGNGVETGNSDGTNSGSSDGGSTDNGGHEFALHHGHRNTLFAQLITLRAACQEYKQVSICEAYGAAYLAYYGEALPSSLPTETVAEPSFMAKALAYLHDLGYHFFAIDSL